MTDLDLFFQRSARSVETRISELIDTAHVGPPRLKDAMCWSLFGGGKRFRPALMLAVGSVFDVDEDKLLSTAAAVEMIHTYSLIHDDLPAMDDDDLRRGRETCHKKFDEATAILAGDALQVLAFRSIADDTNVPPATRLSLCRGLAVAALRMVEGQQLDLDYEGREVSVADLESVHVNKTGALIAFSASAALEIGEVPEPAFGAVLSYAAKLGLLFQVSDDVLDVTESTSTLGKTAAKDLSSGKATYPSVLGLAASRELLASLHRDAVADLEPLGRSAGLLGDIAAFIVDRRS